MEQFPHLKFAQKLIGKPRFHGGGGDAEQSVKNKRNRQGHSSKLEQRTNQIKLDWTNEFQERPDNLLATNLDKEVVPVFLQINPEKLPPAGASVK